MGSRTVADVSDERAQRTRRRWSFPIGRIAGIEVRVHASFFLLVALFVVAGAAPEGPGVVASLGWLVALFGCVLFHELAHCLVGRRHGLVVHEIDLLPIGGVSRLETFPETPRDEFAMAIAGPAASAALGVAAGLCAVLVSQPLYPVDFVNGGFLPRLAWLNLLLAAFNMLPAFPLDGGRVFRSLLERRYDLARATQIAGSTGRWLALLLIALGLFWNLWLAIIGVFIYLGASAEVAATLIHLRLAGRRVRDVMLVSPTTIDAGIDAATLRHLVRRDGQGTFPVVERGRYVGVVDVAAIERSAPTACAGNLADRTAVTLAPGDDLEGDVPALAGAPGHAVAVVDGDEVVGLLRLDEINRLVAGPGPGGSLAGSE
jgi:stage IV sporulation protein FB